MYSPSGVSVMSIMKMLFALRQGFGSLRQNQAHLCYAEAFLHFRMAQSGAQRLAFDALLLLALPVELTFHVLLALPRFAERNRQFCAYSLHPSGVPFPVRVSPCPDEIASLDCLFTPICHTLAFEMKYPVSDLDKAQKNIALNGSLIL